LAAKNGAALPITVVKGCMFTPPERKIERQSNAR